jgi:DNA-binding GntR family transcriptional regulator
MSTVDQIERTLLDELLRGEHQPGSPLRQDELATRLGVSKIPVREALQRLGAGGLLVFESNRGARVPVLSVDDAIENATLRRAIEIELLRHAVPRLSVVDLASAEYELDRAHLTMRSTTAGTHPADDSAAGPATDSATAANWRFHRALYRGAGWARGLAIAEMLHAAMAPYVQLYLRGLGGRDPSDDEHRALLESCRDGNVDAAIDLLTTHLDNATATVIDFLRSEPTR